ncbi:MAG TPA: hypothetical protein VFL76_01925 [Edaphocola sp.]|nr:hypothetical protein [Edaphocola sp.]
MNLRLMFAGVLSCCSLTLGWGQHHASKSTKAKEPPKETLNQRNAKGERTGLWYIDQKARMGQDACITFGQYDHDEKQGLWYKLDALGRLISIENYTNGVLNGTSQYYEKGNLICIGNFRGLNTKQKFDSVWVTDPVTGYDTMVVVPTESGSLRHGLWRYYNPVTGQLTAEERYQVGTLISRKEFNAPQATDSVRYERVPRHRPIDIKRATRKVPDYARQKIGY